jgi:predicted DNA-binding transcriptional regulator AlpA
MDLCTAAKGLTDPLPIDVIRVANLIAQEVLSTLRGDLKELLAQRTGTGSLSLPSVQSEQLLTDKEVAEILKVSKQTVWRWTKVSQSFPKPLKIEKGSTRWRLSEIMAFEACSASAR